MVEPGANRPERINIGPHATQAGMYELLEVDVSLRPYLRPAEVQRFVPFDQFGPVPVLAPPPTRELPLPVPQFAPPVVTPGIIHDGPHVYPAYAPAPPAWSAAPVGVPLAAPRPAPAGPPAPPWNVQSLQAPPRVDIFQEVDRFAHQAVQAAAGKTFDVIHAHDWMTFRAGMAIADMTGRPLILHVHSTEFDRSGREVDQRIFDLEQAGMQRADAVIAVSYLTRGVIVNRYGVPADKVHVVYNALDGGGPRPPRAAFAPIRRDEKIVLFLGRITMQKGPEYFLAAARKVLQVYENVRFVMAGSGDMVRQTIELATEMGLGRKVLFTGFLRGRDVERVYRSADMYVMPSVSDPFGIATLEAISYDVPVLVSKQSGVAEVLQHVLKADFWDIDDLANKIVAVLRHPPLRGMLKTQAGYEVRRLTWLDSARRCVEIFRTAVALAPRELQTGRQRVRGV